VSRPGTLLLATALLCALPILAARAEEETGQEARNPVAVIKTSMGEIQVELFRREAPKTVANFLGLAEGTKPFRDARTGEMVQRPFYDGLTFHRVLKGFMIQGGCPRGDGRGGPGYTFEDEIDAVSLGLHEIKALTDGRPHAWLLPVLPNRETFNARILQPLMRRMGITTQEEAERRWPEVLERLGALTLKDAYELMGYRYLEGVGSHKPVKGVIAMANAGPATNGSQFFIDLEDTPGLTGRHTVFGRVISGMDVVQRIGAVKTGLEDKPIEDVKILSIRRRAD